ncbi:Gfo/Idh/MocA family oxidoreductase [Allokutzneria sp. A3M-2-11 16]|uniref:Gfo/Idh/MocA family protein n=1 Tax=Allokutzneria sp. A3M-2-11 16 TaxID=2962043 RepID=UPI0020B7C9E9|nr:Gfo/Idh/MocA family oxidoreductase [Allokutzneria sp. A3M-2-11 16]MCP3803098.1 Gfo/Idh/MocA family oxidoreductase [Allokutzneria sp. A3M-2-11 16]
MSMRFAIIGCGVIGVQHAAAIAALPDRATLVLAVDPVVERARALGAEWTTSVEEALARPDIDAVAVCTPSGTHADLAVAALEAGKHVVIEKPLDVNVSAVARVAAAQKRAGRTVTVISQHRFDPSSQAVYRAIQDGRFGRITSGVASVAWWRGQDYYDSGAWRGTWELDGGGALMNQSIHTIDLLVWMLGEPVEVFAWSACLAHTGIEVEDTAVANVRFASGALGVIHGTTAAYPGLSARLQVHGSLGSAVIDNDALTYFGDAEVAGRSSVGAGSDPAALSDVHIEQYRDFLGAVEEGREPLVTVGEGGRTLGVVCAIYESVRSGRPVLL